MRMDIIARPFNASGMLKVADIEPPAPELKVATSIPFSPRVLYSPIRSFQSRFLGMSCVRIVTDTSFVTALIVKLG